MINVRNNSGFKVIFDRNNASKRCDVIEVVELSVKRPPAWTKKILEATIIWMAKLECGHVAGPYTRTNSTPLPTRMVCSKCNRKRQ